MTAIDTSDVVEWDEYGQGYDERGRCIICICGTRLTQPGSLNPDGSPHYCPASEPVEESENGR
jgi:hypothetical protein